MFGLAATVFAFGDFANTWRAAPSWIPWHQFLADGSAVVMLVCGAGLLWERAQAWSARVLQWYWALLAVLLKLPIVAKHPLIEGAWQGLAHFALIFGAAWLLVRANVRTVRSVQVLFGLGMIPVALAHFVYPNLTTPLVPAWVPVHVFWTYFTGIAMFAAAAALLLGIQALLATSLLTVLFAMFTFLVWPPLLLAKPSSGLWSEIAMSWAICAATWIVAVNMPH